MKSIVLFSDIKYKDQVISAIESFIRVPDDFVFYFYQIGFYEEVTIPGLKVECRTINPGKDFPNFSLLKPVVIKRALEELDHFIYIDADTVASKHFNYNYLVSKVHKFPLATVLHNTEWQYPHYFWFEDGIRYEVNEGHMMKYLGVKERTQKWVTATIFAVDNTCKEFVDEWAALCSNEELWNKGKTLEELNPVPPEVYRVYFHMPDESALNTLLWKYGVTNYYEKSAICEPKLADSIIKAETSLITNTILEESNPTSLVTDSKKLFVYHHIKDPDLKRSVLEKLIKLDNIKFGIYTSFYNSEKYIDKLFSNIESLTYDNFEWHITDDFSTDNTLQLIKERLQNSTIKDKIKLVTQSTKKEMYWFPNKFFDSSFNWIMLVDSDDEIEINALNVLNNVLKNNDDDLALISTDFHKTVEDTNALHSISYISNREKISKKIEKYHPACDYLNNINYYCFGHMRVFKNLPQLQFRVTDKLACAEDSYRVFWSNSYGKYLHVPRALYKWVLRDDSESHGGTVPPNFNENFDIALNKLKATDFGVDKRYNEVYIETSALQSIPLDVLRNTNKIGLFTRNITTEEESLLHNLYCDKNVKINQNRSDLNVICLNYISEHDLPYILSSLKTSDKIVLYYQNQNLHYNDENRDIQLKQVIERYKDVLISNNFQFSWWSYIRHLIIKVNI